MNTVSGELCSELTVCLSLVYLDKPLWFLDHNDCRVYMWWVHLICSLIFCMCPQYNKFKRDYFIFPYFILQDRWFLLSMYFHFIFLFFRFMLFSSWHDYLYVFFSAFVYLELASPPTWSLVPLILYWKAHRSNTSSACPRGPHHWCFPHICGNSRVYWSCFISDLRNWFQNYARIWLASWQIWHWRNFVSYHISKDNSW